MTAPSSACAAIAYPNSQTMAGKKRRIGCAKASLPSRKKSEPAETLLGRYPYETEYGDHFETSYAAYRDLRPLLSLVATVVGKSKRELAIYDPYYCEGACIRHLRALGFENVRNVKEDFYASAVYAGLGPPEYDVLVTNPPYSGDHKERIFRFAVACGKPWAVLVPAYVLEKSYFPMSVRPFFVSPNTGSYDFDHPHGTGHDVSPFESVWVVHLGQRTDALFRRLEHDTTATYRRTIQDLIKAGVVRGSKRPNPRQRRKRRNSILPPNHAPGEKDHASGAKMRLTVLP